MARFSFPRFCSCNHAVRVIICGAVSTIATISLADVNLPSVFGDHMVLQRDTAVTIWGWDNAGQEITITPGWSEDATVRTRTNSDGEWSVKLPTPDAGGPYRIAISGSTGRTLEDVMIGDVWLCSGQSNMEMPVGNVHPGYSGVNSAETEISGAADYPDIRFFTVENTVSLHPRADARGEWARCSPETVRTFSATGYFFGRQLNDALEVPIGLISADYGGTVAQAWTSESTLRKFDEFTSTLNYLDEMKDPNLRVDAVQNQEERWWSELDSVGNISRDWNSLSFDDGDWSTMELPQTLSIDGLDQFDGIVYFRKVIELPESSTGKNATLSLGPIDDYDDAWINGVQAGSEHRPGFWGSPRNYEVPSNVLRSGRNVIAIRMLDTAGPGGINGQAAQMKLEITGEDPVSLAGDWHYRRGPSVDKLPPQPEGVGIHANMPGVLFNGMISPICPYTIRGVIWYQGESNRGQANLYRRLFPAMIRDWRAHWNIGDFPFYFVQIAPFEYGGDTGQTASLREAQAHALEVVPNVGMAVTMDIGNPRDIHPKNKQAVGDRLARIALAETYGRDDVVYSGPMFKSLEIKGSAAIIHFDHVDDGLAIDGDKLQGFVVAGKDRQFVYANASIHGDTVVVTSREVPDPVAVRYGWMAAPVANLENKAGLPAAPFRTDNWDDNLPPTDNSLEMESYRSIDPGFRPLFNERDLTDWANVNCAPSTWRVDDGVIHCSGIPTGVLRTEEQYQNFILELEWRHLRPYGNAGVFIWSDPLTARGQPFTRSIEVQVMDGLEGDWYTSDGDVFPIHGAMMKPENARSGSDRAYPTDYRANDSPLWNHYRIECVDGTLKLAVNGKVVTVGRECSPRMGYICLESEGSPVDFRNIRIKELPSDNGALSSEQIADVALGFRTLYNSVNFDGWKFTDEHAGHWKAANWVIDFDGEGPDLWTNESFGDFELICDWRWSGPATEVERPIILANGEYKLDANGNQVMQNVQDAGDSGIYLRGSSKSQVNMWCWPIGSGEVYGYRTDPNMPASVRQAVTPKVAADRPIGEWNRFHITMKGDRLTVVLNDELVIDSAQLPGVAATGPIALQRHGSPVQFANIFIRELD